MLTTTHADDRLGRTVEVVPHFDSTDFTYRGTTYRIISTIATGKRLQDTIYTLRNLSTGAVTDYNHKVLVETMRAGVPLTIQK